MSHSSSAAAQLVDCALGIVAQLNCPWCFLVTTCNLVPWRRCVSRCLSGMHML